MRTIVPAGENEKESLELLEVADGAQPGWARAPVFRDRSFIKAAALIAGYGIIVSVMHYLFNRGRLPYYGMDMYRALIFAAFLGGGLHIAGFLDRRKSALIGLTAAASQVWHFLFFETGAFNSPAMYCLIFLINCLPLAIWLKTDPEMMAAVGLRRGKLAADAAKALAMAAALGALFGYCFHVFNLPLKENAATIAATAADFTPQQIFMTILFFSLWQKLRAKGLTIFEGVLVFAFLFLILNAPIFTVFTINGKIKPIQGVTGLAAGVLINSVVIPVTFRYLKNPLPASFLMTSFLLIATAAGVT